VIVRGDAAVQVLVAGQRLRYHVGLFEPAGGVGKALGVEPLGALVDHGDLEADVVRERGQLFRHVARAEDDERGGRAVLLEKDGHLPAAAHAQVVREVGLERLRLRGGVGEQGQRRVDHLLLDRPAADGAAQRAVTQHHQSRAGLLRGAPVRGGDGAQHEGSAFGLELRDVGEERHGRHAWPLDSARGERVARLTGFSTSSSGRR
jgi:hypothetical protein